MKKWGKHMRKKNELFSAVILVAVLLLFQDCVLWDNITVIMSNYSNSIIVCLLRAKTFSVEEYRCTSKEFKLETKQPCSLEYELIRNFI